MDRNCVGHTQYDSFPYVFIGTPILCNEYVILINMGVTCRVEKIEEHRDLNDFCKVICKLCLGR